MSATYTTYEGLPRVPRGKDHSRSKLNEKKVLQIRALYEKGWPKKRIAEKFGVCAQNIALIIEKVTWKHV